MEMRTGRRILAVRTDRIGDVVCITPALAAMRQLYPDAHLAVLVSPYAQDVLTGNPDVDEIIPDGPFWATLRRLRSGRFDTAVVFFVTARAAALVRLAGIKRSIGPASKAWSLLLTDMVRQNRSESVKHEADYNLELLRQLSREIPRAGTKVVLSPEEARWAEYYIASRCGITGDRQLVIIHPGSGGSAKDWPLENFAALADALAEAAPAARVLFTGSAREQAVLQWLDQRTGSRHKVLREELPLRRFIALVSRARLLVANSTGPLHVAVALGVRTVSFYPPLRACSPTRWGPYGAGHLALTPPVAPCAECVRACRTPDCMRFITVSSALQAAQAQLALGA